MKSIPQQKVERHMPTLLITGGHKGLGLAAVERIVARNCFDVVLAGRNSNEVRSAAQRLAQAHGCKVLPLHMDVSSLGSVRHAVAEFKAMVVSGDVAPLKVLLPNAGAQFLSGAKYSDDGYEMTFATNFLGHFLLTNLLLEEIIDGGSIVFTASGTHDPNTMDGRMVGKAVAPDATALANTGKNGKLLSGGQRYSTSKLCVMLFAYELDRRLKAAEIEIASIAFDPGLIMATGLGRSAPAFAQRLTRTAFATWLFKTLGVTMGSLDFSGESLANIAMGETFADKSGTYIQSNSGQLVETRSSDASYDRQAATKLWRDASLLVGLKPSLRFEKRR
jgi:NAD(P)-dependent dehydrogenase (short-subunit alcohol dehydrogenase family)